MKKMDPDYKNNGNIKWNFTKILIDGWTVGQIEEKLTGVQCGRRGTSCADQLAKAVRAAFEAQERGEVQNSDED